MVSLHPLASLQCQLSEVTSRKYPENYRDIAGTFPLLPLSVRGCSCGEQKCVSRLFFGTMVLCVSPPCLSGLQKLQGMKRRAASPL